MQVDTSRAERRLVRAGLTGFGLAHLVPRLLLRITRSAYGLALDVEFLPRERAARRVRWVGLCSLLATVLGWAALDFDRVAEDRAG